MRSAGCFARTASLVGIFAAAGLVSVWRAGSAEACSCLADSDPGKQRTRQMAESDLVFKGSVLRSAYRDAVGWTCDFDIGGGKPKSGCIIVRVTGGLCQPITGVSVDVERDGGGGTRKRGYTDAKGQVTICGLAAGDYGVEARTIRGKPVRSQLKYDASKGATLAVGLVEPEEPRVFTTEFRVESVLKGPAVKTATVDTAEASGNCGFGSFRPHTSYEVFAKKTPTGRYTVDLCSGTRAMSGDR